MRAATGEGGRPNGDTSAKMVNHPVACGRDYGPPHITQDRKTKIIACPAKKIDRVIIELCTSTNSRIGQKHQRSEGCLVVRITEDDDLTSSSGVDKALSIIEQYAGLPILIWVSVPCTGGSQWQRLNMSTGKRDIQKMMNRNGICVCAEYMHALWTWYMQVLLPSYLHVL